MLVDVALRPGDAFMVQKAPDGWTTLSIPLDVLKRALEAYMADKPRFDMAAQQQEGASL